jgi:hypothetical protein
MSDTPGIAELYRFAHTSFHDFAITLSAHDWSTPVPCTPEWTARDVLSHVSGIPDDAFAGRMEGAPGEAWTAAQVARNRDASVDELLERWAQQASDFADVLESMGERRPPLDLHTHEHDLRHALDRPGARSNVIVETAGYGLASVGSVAVRLVIELDDGRVVVSGDTDGSAEVTLRDVSVFELFRSRTGRRSREQVLDYDWTGRDADIDAVLECWFVFGPSPLPIVE